MKYLIVLSLIFLNGCEYQYSKTTENGETKVSVEVSHNTPEPSQNVPQVPQTPSEETVEDHVASTPVGPEYPVADVKKVFTVKIEDDNYSLKQKEKLNKAEKIIERIVNSEDYKKEVLSAQFTNTRGLSNEQIYEKLFQGAEALVPAVNYQMDLKVSMYYAAKRTVGYTYPNDMKVYTNSKYHDNYTACEVASNLFHEWTHKMGFDHSSAQDSNSVPYYHNTIVKKLCPKFQ